MRPARRPVVPIVKSAALRMLLLAAAFAGGCTTKDRPTFSEPSALPHGPAPGPSSAIGSTERSLLLGAHNDARRSRGRAPLHSSAALDGIAQAAADLLAAGDRLTHDVGGGFARRLMQSGYPPPAAENLALGYDDAAAVTAGWMRSRPHRSNLLGREWTHVGFGIARRPDGSRIDVAVYGTR